MVKTGNVTLHFFFKKPPTPALMDRISVDAQNSKTLQFCSLYTTHTCSAFCTKRQFVFNTGSHKYSPFLQNTLLSLMFGLEIVVHFCSNLSKHQINENEVSRWLCYRTVTKKKKCIHFCEFDIIVSQILVFSECATFFHVLWHNAFFVKKHLTHNSLYSEQF